MSTFDPGLSYEAALQLLDQRLRSLESENLSLEQALNAVDEARDLLRICNQRLEEAQRRLEVRPPGGEPNSDQTDGDQTNGEAQVQV